VATLLQLSVYNAFVVLCRYLRIENAEGYVLIAVYLFICMRVTRITKKVLNQIAWNSVGWLVIIQGPFDYILGSIGSKVKVMKRPKSSFYHQFVSNWHATNANMFITQCPILWYAKVCALPSARSSLLVILHVFLFIWMFCSVWTSSLNLKVGLRNMSLPIFTAHTTHGAEGLPEASPLRLRPPLGEKRRFAGSQNQHRGGQNRNYHQQQAEDPWTQLASKLITALLLTWCNVEDTH